MPSAVDLSAEFDVATSTAQKVMSHLQARGFIRAEMGLGSYVTARPAQSDLAALSDPPTRVPDHEHPTARRVLTTIRSRPLP